MMTAEQRAAVAWAIKMLDGFLALTGCIIKHESRAHLDVLRGMVKP